MGITRRGFLSGFAALCSSAWISAKAALASDVDVALRTWLNVHQHVVSPGPAGPPEPGQKGQA